MIDCRRVIIAVVLLILSFTPSGISFGQEAERHNYKPIAGYVPNDATAIKIAVAVWTPIHGKAAIEKEKTYKAVLRGGVWYISGSLPVGYAGGVTEAEIAQDDGSIMRISHGK